MTFHYTQPYVVVGAFIVRDGKLLLIQENHEPDKGKWNIPAGKLDFNEDPIDAAKREAFEEAGIAFTPTDVIGLHSIYRKDVPGEIHALRIVYQGAAEGDVSLEYGEAVEGVSEIADYQWMPLDEVLKMDDALLRYHDIKNLTQDFLDGKSYPLDVLRHVVQGR